MHEIKPFYELHRLTVYHGKRVSLHMSSTIHLRSCTIKITTLFSAQLRFSSVSPVSVFMPVTMQLLPYFNQHGHHAELFSGPCTEPKLDNECVWQGYVWMKNRMPFDYINSLDPTNLQNNGHNIAGIWFLCICLCALSWFY